MAWTALYYIIRGVLEERERRIIWLTERTSSPSLKPIATGPPSVSTPNPLLCRLLYQSENSSGPGLGSCHITLIQTYILCISLCRVTFLIHIACVSLSASLHPHMSASTAPWYDTAKRIPEVITHSIWSTWGAWYHSWKAREPARSGRSLLYMIQRYGLVAKVGLWGETSKPIDNSWCMAIGIWRFCHFVYSKTFQLLACEM